MLVAAGAMLVTAAQAGLADGASQAECKRVPSAWADTRDKVQLWKGGPYWATANIGAESPEDCGCYFGRSVRPVQDAE